jgi:hypothetical protein
MPDDPNEVEAERDGQELEVEWREELRSIRGTLENQEMILEGILQFSANPDQPIPPAERQEYQELLKQNQEILGLLKPNESADEKPPEAHDEKPPRRPLLRKSRQKRAKRQK